MSVSADPRVLLVANYAADRQPSMLRFAATLHEQLAALGVDVEVSRPPVIAGRAPNGAADGIRKWLGYLDKFLLYPPRLRRGLSSHASRSTVVHICDHSNAMYVPWIRHVPHVVTCHDLLAVRRALGEFGGERTRWSGRRLQEMIRRGLRAASCIVSDSVATRDDVQRLVGGAHRETVIPPAVSQIFTRRSEIEAVSRVARLRPDPRRADWPQRAARPFILHVGGNQWYKNRAGLLDIYAALAARMPAAPTLVLAGAPPTRDLSDRIVSLSLQDRVVSFSDLSDDDLACLYSAAALLVFPSRAEGFGWPVAEAMACGCRVVTSAIAPMTDVAGDAATYIDPQNVEAAAATIESVLREPDTERQARIAAGLSRAAGLSGRAMATGYVAVYRDVLRRDARVA